MIRMTKPLGRYVLAVLHYLRIEKPDAMRDFHSKEIQEWIQKWTNQQPPYNVSNRQRGHLFDPESGMAPAQMGIDAAIEKVERYVGAERGEKVTDLFDQLASLLKDLFPRNRLSGDAMKILKNTILRGDEAAEATRYLKEKYLSCAGADCGHKFNSTSEGVCLSREANGEYTLYCARCQQARVIACYQQSCNGVSPTSREFQIAWLQASQASNCGVRHKNKKPEAPFEEEDGRSASRPPLDVSPGASILGAGAPLSARRVRFGTTTVGRPPVTPRADRLRSLQDDMLSWASNPAGQAYPPPNLSPFGDDE